MEDLPEIEIIEEAPVAPVKAEAETTEELDLSSEWASVLEETKHPNEIEEQKAAAPAPPVSEEIDITEFLERARSRRGDSCYSRTCKDSSPRASAASCRIARI